MTSSADPPPSAWLSATVAYQEGRYAVLCDRHSALAVVLDSPPTVPTMGRCFLSDAPVAVYQWPLALEAPPPRGPSVPTQHIAAAVVASDVPSFSDEDAGGSGPVAAPALASSIPPLPLELQHLMDNSLPPCFKRVVIPSSPFIAVAKAFHTRSLRSGQVTALPFASVSVINALPIDSCVYFQGKLLEPPCPMPGHKGITISLADDDGAAVTVSVWPEDIILALNSARVGSIVSIERAFTREFKHQVQLMIPYPLRHTTATPGGPRPASASPFERHSVEPVDFKISLAGSTSSLSHQPSDSFVTATSASAHPILTSTPQSTSSHRA